MQRGGSVVPRIEEDYPFEETSVFQRPGFPRLHFIEQRYSGDCTNWWIPNRACSEAMLRSAGFEILAHPEEEVYVCRRVEVTSPWPRAVYPARAPERERTAG